MLFLDWGARFQATKEIKGKMPSLCLIVLLFATKEMNGIASVVVNGIPLPTKSLVMLLILLLKMKFSLTQFPVARLREVTVITMNVNHELSKSSCVFLCNLHEFISNSFAICLSYQIRARPFYKTSGFGCTVNFDFACLYLRCLVDDF